MALVYGSDMDLQQPPASKVSEALGKSRLTTGGPYRGLNGHLGALLHISPSG